MLSENDMSMQKEMAEKHFLYSIFYSFLGLLPLSLHYISGNVLIFNCQAMVFVAKVNFLVCLDIKFRECNLAGKE